jgi:hypothetical protein
MNIFIIDSKNLRMCDVDTFDLMMCHDKTFNSYFDDEVVKYFIDKAHLFLFDKFFLEYHATDVKK